MICLSEERRPISNLVLLSYIAVITHNCEQVQLQKIVSGYESRQANIGGHSTGTWSRKDSPQFQTSIINPKRESSIVSLKKNENFTFVELPSGLNFKRDELPLFKKTKSPIQFEYPPVSSDPDTPSFLSQFSSTLRPNRVNVGMKIAPTKRFPINQLQPEGFDIKYRISHNDDILNRTKAALPPSLPNLEIIPFVASDALDIPSDSKVDDEKDQLSGENGDSETFQQQKFLPPTKTEGGFMPRDPFSEQEIPYIFTNAHNDYSQTNVINKTTNAPATKIMNNNTAAIITSTEPAIFIEDKQNINNSSERTIEKFIHLPYDSHKLINISEESYNNYTTSTKSVTTLKTTTEKAIDESDNSFLLNDLLTYIFDDQSKEKDETVDSIWSMDKNSVTETTTKYPLISDQNEVSSALPSDVINSTHLSNDEDLTMGYDQNQTNLNTKIQKIDILLNKKETSSTEGNFYQPSRYDTIPSLNYNDTNFIRRQDINVGINTDAETVMSPSVIKNFVKIAPNTHSYPLIGGGILKLSGCNIFGKTYSTDTIIEELSEPCSQCMCTEDGVKCAPSQCSVSKTATINRV